MAGKPELLSVIEFGQFRVLPHRRELLVEDVPTEIGGRAFDALMALIESPGKVVSKNVLMECIWPDQIVEVSSLHAVISSLRGVLAADRSLIRTIAGRGYQFTGVVRKVPANTVLTPDDAISNRLSTLAPTNLPETVSELIGRDAEIAQVAGLTGSHRLVTLAGAAGIGKTRLAIEAARSLAPGFSDGTWIAELGPLSDAARLPITLAAVLGIEVSGNVTSVERVAKALGLRQVLLVLDNCEHVIDAAARMAEALVRANPEARVIATSREPLRVEGEWVFPMSPLTVPLEANRNAGDLLGYSAVRLFISRARAAGLEILPGANAIMETVVAICRHLDGIPLAIELAAARAAALGIEELGSRLDDQFDLLTSERRTAVPRQRTLRATLDWSYDLLPPVERQILNRLSVFAGSFTPEAARAVAAFGETTASDVMDGIVGLIGKSLVATDVSTSKTRYRLIETTRAYAREKLSESGERGDVARRHAEYYRDLFQRPVAACLLDHGPDTDNVRAALDWAFSPDGDSSVGIALTVASAPDWFQFSRMEEYRGRIERALARIETGSAQAEVLRYPKGRTRQAGEAWSNVVKRAEAINEAEFLHLALWGLWSYHMGNGEARAALAAAEQFATLAVTPPEALNRPIGDLMVGAAQHYLGEQANARHHLERLLEAYGNLSETHTTGMPYDHRQLARGFLARVLWVQGLPDQAMRVARSAARDAHSHPPSACAVLALAACPVALFAGELTAAEDFVATLFNHTSRDALDPWAAWGRCIEGMLLIKRGDTRNGLRLLQTEIDRMRHTGYMLPYTTFLSAVAECLAELGQIGEGLTSIDEVLGRSKQNEELWCYSELLRLKGVLLSRSGMSGAIALAEDHIHRGLNLAHQQGAASWELRCATSLARLWRDQARPDEARALLAPIYDRFAEGFGTDDLKAAKSVINQVS